MTGTYKMHELMKNESVRDFVDSKLMDAVLELNEFNRDGQPNHLALTVNQGHFGQDGPGLQVLRAIHDGIMLLARPISGKRPKGLPSWATHQVEGDINLFKSVLLKEGYTNEQARALFNPVRNYFKLNDLVWKEAPRSEVFYTRRWPSDLNEKTIFLSKFQKNQYAYDHRTEKRIEEETEKNKTVVVRYDYRQIELPKASDPESFMRYAVRLKKILDHQEQLIDSLETQVTELETKVEELEDRPDPAWVKAEQDLARLMQNGAGSLPDD